MRIQNLIALAVGLLIYCPPMVVADGISPDPLSISKRAASDEPGRLKALFSDMPDYAALLPVAPGMKTPPRLIAESPPASPAFLESGKKATVIVAVAISEQGDVAAARVFKSDDSRCDPLAVAAILQWKFAPATNGAAPIKCVVELPVQFIAPPVGAQHINVAIGAFAYDMQGLSLHAPMQLQGTDLASIKGARVTVTRAVDDTGADLKGNGPGAFFKPAVGRTSDEELVATRIVMPSINLRAPSKLATQLSSVEGFLELVFPSVDPKATVYVSQVPKKLGVPVVSAELAAAKVTVTIFDQTAFAAAVADPRDPANVRGLLVDSPYAAMPGWKPPVSPAELTDRDIVIAIDDPDGRLVGVEFQTVYGAPVTYNHNGWMHFEKSPGKRFSIYRLGSKIADNLKLVCWLATDRSTLKQSFHLTNVALPAHR